MVQQELEGWETSCIKPGMGLHDAGLAALRAFFVFTCSVVAATSGLLYKAFSTDVSGWDWCVRQWLTMILWMILCVQLDVDPRSPRGVAMLALELSLMHRFVVLSDGSIWHVPDEIGWTTGRFLTANGNSKMRVALALLCLSVHPFAMGDDCVEFALALRVDLYERFGFRVEASDLPQGCLFEFCSMQFFADGSYRFMNAAKCLFRLLSCHIPSLEQFVQFQYECRHAPEILPFSTLVWKVWNLDRLAGGL
jgi:hypothetical protein